MKKEKKMEIFVEDKGSVVVNTAHINEPDLAAEVVRLDMVNEGKGERRFRLRTPAGNEGRISEADKGHTQSAVIHGGTGVYVLKKGWIAIFTKDSDLGLVVKIAFAKSDQHFVSVPKNIWYVPRLSGPVAWSYACADGQVGPVNQDDFFAEVDEMSDTQVLQMYAEQEKIAIDDVLAMAEKSLN